MYQRRMFTEELALQLSENESNKLHFEMEAINNNIYAITLLELIEISMVWSTLEQR